MGTYTWLCHIIILLYILWFREYTKLGNSNSKNTVESCRVNFIVEFLGFQLHLSNLELF